MQPAQRGSEATSPQRCGKAFRLCSWSVWRPDERTKGPRLMPLLFLQASRDSGRERRVWGHDLDTVHLRGVGDQLWLFWTLVRNSEPCPPDENREWQGGALRPGKNSLWQENRGSCRWFTVGVCGKERTNPDHTQGQALGGQRVRCGQERRWGPPV